MDVLLTIGEFAKMTHLSVKALRHYHDLGLLEPADVDPTTGYRSYTTAQVPTAQVIRRFRDLDMPLDEVRVVLQAPDEATRNRTILQHLERMETRLEQTHSAVASLRSLLEAPAGVAHHVEHRHLFDTSALAVRERVRRDDIGPWCGTVYALLHDTLVGAGASQGGVDGALYFDEFFETDAGDVMAFIPLVASAGIEVADGGRVHLVDLAGGHYAVLEHVGPFGELDRAYGALGAYVTERGIGVAGPIREHYLVGPDQTPDERHHRTEVCWPIAA